MSKFPEKLEQSEKYDEQNSVVLGECYDDEITAEIVRRYGCHKQLLKACETLQKDVHEQHCDLHPLGQSELCKIAKAAIAAADQEQSKEKK